MKIIVRVVIVFILIAAGIVAAELKKEDVRNTRAAKVTTILSELQEKGAPIEVVKLQPLAFSVRKKVSFTPCNRNSYCFSLTRQEFAQAKVGSPIFIDNSQVGKVSVLASSPSLATGLFEGQAQISLAKSDRGRVVADIVVGQRKNVMVVPMSAVVFQQGKPFVYVLSDNETTELVEVTLGENNGVEYVVDKGLRPGVTLIVEGMTQIARYKKVSLRVGEGEI